MDANKIKERREQIKLEEKEAVKDWQKSFMNGLHECLSRNTQCTYNFQYLEGDETKIRNWYPLSDEVIDPLLPDIKKSGIDIIRVNEQWPFVKKKILFVLE